MDISVPILTEDARAALVCRVAALVPAMAARAGALDEAGAFPDADVADLREAGLFAALAPRARPGVPGGLGVGTEPDGALAALDMLRLIGRGNLAVGRLVEAHMNALKLVCAYGDTDAVRAACADSADGHLFGLWVTGEGLRLQAGVLQGGKDIGSGAGFVTRALVTVNAGGASPVMMLADVSAGRVAGTYMRLTGMRAACNAAMDLDGLAAGPAIGAPGDYLRQPVFSGGAWRTSAVTLGGIEALVEAVVTALVRRGRADDPYQLARIGRLKLEVHTAHLWLRQAAPMAECDAAAPDVVVAFVNLARVAVERAGLEAVQLAQQCLGLSGMVRGQPAERIMRDLATYLRQPAGDEALTEAARYFAHNRLPAP
jgi:alkylation response protein AidB-like acyl-CoA dehydrogenase